MRYILAFFKCVSWAIPVATIVALLWSNFVHAAGAANVGCVVRSGSVVMVKPCASVSRPLAAAGGHVAGAVAPPSSLSPAGSLTPLQQVQAWARSHPAPRLNGGR